MMAEVHLETNRNPNERRAGRVARGVVSILIVLYGCSLLVVATASSPLSRPPLISEYLLDYVGPILHPLQLDTPHRYYTPDPAPQQGLWIRIVYESGAERWIDWPSREDATAHIHTRRRMLPVVISDRNPLPLQPELSSLAPSSRIIIASVTRRLSRELAGERPDGSTDAVASLQYYSIDNSLIAPVQIQAGWGFRDLRLIRATYLGAYAPSGTKLGEAVCTPVPIAELAARIIENEIAPQVSDPTDEEHLTQTLDGLEPPSAVRQLIMRHPELLLHRGDELRAAIRAAVFSDDVPGIPLEPGVDYQQEWQSSSTQPGFEIVPNISRHV